MSSAYSSFSEACAALDINSYSSTKALVAVLEPITAQLARSKQEREQLGQNDTLWTDLRKLWHDLSRSQLSFWDNDDSDDETDGAIDKRNSGLMLLAASLARFTRNLVADVPQNQLSAYENEPSIRQLLHYYTSWSSMQDEQALLVARVLAQALSNLVTGNEFLISRLWNTYMNLPEDQSVIIRLLSSPDARSLLATLMLILNCIDSSRTRMKMLTRTVAGVRICVHLLDNMVRLYDAEDGSEGARAFDIGYEIFSRIISVDLVPCLFTRLSMTDEIITPHQTTLLKLVDSYLQTAKLSPIPATPQGTSVYTKLQPMLAKTFFSLSTYAQNSIQDSLGISPSTPKAKQPPADGTFEPPSSLDVMLPKASEALVLVTQCIVTITLDSMDQPAGESSQDFFNEASAADQGLVESLVGLLRLLDLFLPRINFGKPVRAGGGEAVSPTPTVTQPSGATDGSTGFSYLKRDLVRLLGILCHGKKAVQNRARVCGGIEVVMNLCVVDERNPYLREHAIFTLHNLLEQNSENQAIVEAIKPSGTWDDNGILRDTVGAVRK
ncbi:spinocerebellar ataxia type 10 protein domain-containing protein [Roridomyces roridus]|uniref:Ataxin-10 homolog n=1 Tax=Roridomyces roridus TaxID=1738132 RepID=A0AAD7BKB1_9AGAR|nr:spinocerebellar ataxia type 10 protein domain-containing protein [Roridomyces roridus]